MFKQLIFIVSLSSISMNATIQLTSPAFSHNDQIPIKYTCDGSNVSPTLSWANPPQATKSFALIVDDPDAPKKVWVHWILFNIPAGVYTLKENFNKVNKDNTYITGATDFDGEQKWGGPCPPSGKHRYHFTLYALDTMLDLPAGTKKEELIKAMEDHILEKTTLIGTYQR